MRKVLLALGTDLEPFLANGLAASTGKVFRRQPMPSTSWPANPSAGGAVTKGAPLRDSVKTQKLHLDLATGRQADQTDFFVQPFLYG